jgi:hypothetical protein
MRQVSVRIVIEIQYEAGNRLPLDLSGHRSRQQDHEARNQLEGRGRTL